MIDPKFARNLTLYHVNERNYSEAPINMNTADIDGDIYFDLRTRGLPLECGPWRNMSFWSQLDCSNAEVAVNPDKLSVTKIVLEVDSRFGDYADCNVDPSTGIYTCQCEDAQNNCSIYTDRHPCDMGDGCSWNSDDNHCEEYGCNNITNKEECTQGYKTCVWNTAKEACRFPGGPRPVCNGTLVGYLNLTTKDWGRHSWPGHKLTPIDYWHGNTLAKTYGFWFSTWADGECRAGDTTQTFCSWRLVEVVKKIAKTCSDDAINKVIVDGDKNAPWGARCFNTCSQADQKNTSSKCWIECFYNNVLGPKGTSELLNHTSPDFGIPLKDLHNAWTKPFLPTANGGCPDIR